MPGLTDLMMQRMGDPTNTDLRNQEHEAFSEHVLDTLGPVLGPAVVATSVPAYSGAKALAQSLPGGLADLINRASPVPLSGPTTTAPSWEEVKAGLRPLKRYLRRR